jgi:hypothetical protein
MHQRSEDFFVLATTIKKWRGGVLMQYVAQDISKIGAAKAKKDHS